LAAGGFHDLAYEEFEDAFVAGLVFGDVVGIFGDDVASGLDDGGFADLGAKAFGGDDFGGRTAGVEHGAKTFLPTAPVIFADSTSITSSARAAGETGLAVISLPESFRPRRSSVCIQLLRLCTERRL